MRIKKDYTKRPRSQPVNIAPSVMADEARLSGTSGASQGTTEAMIAHETAMHARVQRSAPPPNARMNKK